MEEQYPKRYWLDLAATNSLLTIECHPRQIGRPLPHRFGTDRLDTKANKRLFRGLPIDNRRNREETGSEEAERD